MSAIAENCSHMTAKNKLTMKNAPKPTTTRKYIELKVLLYPSLYMFIMPTHPSLDIPGGGSSGEREGKETRTQYSDHLVVLSGSLASTDQQTEHMSDGLASTGQQTEHIFGTIRLSSIICSNTSGLHEVWVAQGRLVPSIK